MKIFLDTSAYSALLRGQTEVVDRVRQAEGIILSTVVAGELLSGFRAGKRFEENQRQLRRFLNNAYVSVLPVSLVTADRFARIAARLRAKGGRFRATTCGSRLTRWKAAPSCCPPMSTSRRSTASCGRGFPRRRSGRARERFYASGARMTGRRRERARR